MSSCNLLFDASKPSRIDGMVSLARSTKYTLSTSSRIGFPALLFAVASVVVSSDPVTGYVSKACIYIRGGTNEEDVALDAYIDELIASVEDEPRSVSSEGKKIENSSPNSSVVHTVNRPKKRRNPKKKKKQIEIQADDIADRTEGETTREQTEDANEDDILSFTKDLLPQSSPKDKTSRSELLDDEKEQDKEDFEEAPAGVHPQKQGGGEPKIEAVLDSQQTILGTDNEANPQAVLRRYPPPNALYRFLLDLGIVGQVLALLLMFTTEYLHEYVPFLSTVLSHLLPQRQLNDRMRQERRPMSQFASSAVSSRRTGQTSRQRRKLTKQADQMALDQLKRVGNVQEAKYRYLSNDFLARHGLGTYATSKVNKKTTGEDTTLLSTETGALKKDTGGDWVLDALTKGASLEGENSLSGKPNFSVDIDSKGVSAGFELSLGFDSKQRIQVAKAALSSKNKKKSTSPKVSNRDGFLGRIKAAAGANSKNLLGAYPSDAVSLSEAGDSRGVYNLARRYGWGEWEDEEDNTSFSYSSGSRRKSKRRRASQRTERDYFPSRQTDIGNAKDPIHHQPSRKSKRKSRRTGNEAHEKELSEPSLRNNIAHKTRRTLPRDPLERLLEAQRKSKQDD